MFLLTPSTTSDDAPLPWFIWVIICIIFLGLLAYLISAIRDGVSAVEEMRTKHGNATYTKAETDNIEIYLLQNSYYEKLSLAGKAEFVHRTLDFMNSRTIEGDGNYNPDLATRVHVAAAAIQLTFGLKNFTFEVFDDIILYPDIFRVCETGVLMKGATTPNGIVRISVKDFNEGYKTSTDKLNVGLHEFGHAVYMEFLKAAQQEEEGEASLIHPYQSEADKILHTGLEKDKFLRSYAFTNLHEFFAVAVEHFFEAPQEFKEKLPSLYTLMTKLLNQDPNNSNHDYALTEKFPEVNFN